VKWSTTWERSFPVRWAQTAADVRRAHGLDGSRNEDRQPGWWALGWPSGRGLIEPARRVAAPRHRIVAECCDKGWRGLRWEYFGVGRTTVSSNGGVDDLTRSIAARRSTRPASFSGNKRTHGGMPPLRCADERPRRAPTCSARTTTGSFDHLAGHANSDRRAKDAPGAGKRLVQ
jgi:hypothetical protein